MIIMFIVFHCSLFCCYYNSVLKLWAMWLIYLSRAVYKKHSWYDGKQIVPIVSLSPQYQTLLHVVTPVKIVSCTLLRLTWHSWSIIHFVETIPCSPSNERSFSLKDRMGFITLEKNGKALDLFADEITADRMHAIQVL